MFSTGCQSLQQTRTAGIRFDRTLDGYAIEAWNSTEEFAKNRDDTLGEDRVGGQPAGEQMALILHEQEPPSDFGSAQMIDPQLLHDANPQNHRSVDGDDLGRTANAGKVAYAAVVLFVILLVACCSLGAIGCVVVAEAVVFLVINIADLPKHRNSLKKRITYLRRLVAKSESFPLRNCMLLRVQVGLGSAAVSTRAIMLLLGYIFGKDVSE